MDKWISVEERLPEEHQLVIVDGGIASYRKGRWVREATWADWPGKPILWNVTHWRPIPLEPVDALIDRAAAMLEDVARCLVGYKGPKARNLQTKCQRYKRELLNHETKTD